MYKIGIIDDDSSQIRDIRRVLKENWPNEFKTQLFLKNYNIIDSEDLCDNLFNEIINDINKCNINGLIVDYKIMTNKVKIQGTDLFERIKKLLLRFPIIILTEKVEESLTPLFMDADKVYSKKEFLKINDIYSKEKVHNLYHNINKYLENIARIKQKLNSLRDEYLKDNITQQNLTELFMLEQELGQYILADSPTDVSQDLVNDLKEIVELINKVENME